MKASSVIFVGALAIFSYGLYSFVAVNYLNPKKVEFPSKGYFGSGKERADDTAIKPFKVQVPDSEIEELKRRLKSGRIGHKQLEDVQSFEYGFALDSLKLFQDYWLNHFDWKKQEAKLNSFDQFTTVIEGLKVHFLHVKPPKSYKNVFPLLLVHGWPGNVFEFYKIIPILTDPNKYARQANVDWAFEVIAPSIPGYGWSEAPQKKGFNQMASARMFHKLMTQRLNFKKYFAQGGDWGSLVVSNIGRMYPQSLYGVHLNMGMALPNTGMGWLLAIAGSIVPSWVFQSPYFVNYSLKSVFMEIIRESGYFHLQTTKPDTAGVALNDSPLGLMAYILEKFSTWTNPLFKTMADGGLERKYTKDELLTIVSIYWFNQNILSSVRYYKEFFGDPVQLELMNRYVSVPTGYIAFPHDIGGGSPLELIRQSFNISHYTLLNDGGHFAAFEMPNQLAEDIFSFARELK